MPSISVIVPVYNTEQYLHRCVDSILAQTFTDFELLLVDDGSKDSSGDICDEYAQQDPRIRVFHQTNQGQAAARNHALDWVFANSDSEYISFVDSDDWVHPKYLELLLKCLRQYNVRISQCLHIETNDEAEFPCAGECLLEISPEEEYTHWYSAFIWEKLYRKAVWDNIRFPEGQIYEDVAIWYKILFAEKRIGLVKEPLYYYFINQSSTVRSDWTPAKLKQVEAWEEQVTFANEHGSKPVLQTALSRACWVLKHQYEEICRSSRISEIDKIRYKTKIKGKMKKLLYSRKTELQEAGVYNKYFSWASPLFSHLYWTCHGIASKIKRTFFEK